GLTTTTICEGWWEEDGSGGGTGGAPPSSGGGSGGSGGGTNGSGGTNPCNGGGGPPGIPIGLPCDDPPGGSGDGGGWEPEPVPNQYVPLVTLDTIKINLQTPCIINALQKIGNPKLKNYVTTLYNSTYATKKVNIS